MRRVSIIGILLLSVLFLTYSTAHAQEEQTIGLTATPAIIELAAEPGNTYEREIRIANTSQFSLPVSLAVQSFLTTELVSPSDRYDASQWIVAPFETEIFGANDQRNILLNISVPKDASPGGHYAQLSIRGLSLERESSMSAKSIVIPELIVGIYITVAGDIDESYLLNSVNIASLFMRPNTQNTTNFSVINNGNVHNILSAKLVLEKNNKMVKEVIFTPVAVLPNMKKSNSVDWQLPEAHGVYSVYIELSYGTPAQTLQSKRMPIILSPPIWQLVSLLIFVWIILFSLHNGDRIKKSIRILLKGA